MFYVFHHIPKTAGTSCLRAFGSLFNIVRDYHRSSAPEDLKDYSNNKVDLSTLGRNDVLCGHWNIHRHLLHDRYPDLKSFDARMIIFFRSPFETAESGVRFAIKRGRYDRDKSDLLLLERVNCFSKILRQTDTKCNESNYQDILDSYWFVGLVDQLQLSFDIVTSMLGKKRVVVPHENRTSDIAVSFSKAAIDEFSERNELDQKIYDYAVRRFQAFHKCHTFLSRE